MYRVQSGQQKKLKNTAQRLLKNLSLLVHVQEVVCNSVLKKVKIYI